MDYKTKLQEYMQAERGENPTYVIVKESGPLFVCFQAVADLQYCGVAHEDLLPVFGCLPELFPAEGGEKK